MVNASTTPPNPARAAWLPSQRALQGCATLMCVGWAFLLGIGLPCLLLTAIARWAGLE